ncbi:S1-like domain-containing RNA-binding protein [uncultured Cytophaga sp.]|uniref:CvfB family protein n=1 Tax=uncultured Cytophaga sp. TaxID=160238 RepID=UPI002624D163|nr:S1-like domain-containing RNA-binding protein [uncultured Cytophaga sp.]
MIEVGKNNVLTALRMTSVGMYLGNDAGEELLLPNKYVPDDLKVDDDIDVFIYKDSEDRLIATNLEPKIRLHEFACLTCKDVNSTGAFLEWGLEKDLMVPFREQSKAMEVGKRYPVYLYLDERTGRLAASSKIEGFIEKQHVSLEVGEKVQLLICYTSDLGVNVIINNRYKGIIYHNDLFTHISIGDKVEGYIKNIREEGKIDVTLQKTGYSQIEDSAEKILTKLRSAGGVLKLTDKSDSEEIMFRLQMSKKNFKKAIGGLYKQGIIRLEEDGIYLV